MSKQSLSTCRAYLFLFLAISFIVNSFVAAVPDFLIIIAAFIAIIISLPSMSMMPKIMVMLLLLISHIIFFNSGRGYSFWSNAITESLTYICLFVSAPLLSIPIRGGGYIEYFEGLADRYLKNQTFTYTMIAGLSAILGYFMTIGALYIVKDLFKLKLQENKRLASEMIIQGSAIPLLFSPYINGVAIVLSILGLSLLPFIFYGIILAFLFLMIIIIRLSLSSRQELVAAQDETALTIERDENSRKTQKPMNHRLGIQLLIGFTSIFIGVILLERILHTSFIIIVTLIAFTVPILWLLFVRKFTQLKKEIVNYKNNTLPNIYNHMFLIISAIILSKMMQLTKVPDYLSEFLSSSTGISPLITIFLIILLILVPSLLGIHPLILMVIIATSISPDLLGLDRTLFAITITVGYSLASQLSPLSVLSLVAGNLIGVRPFQLMQWNWKFVVIIVITAALFINTMNLMFH
ncbi:TRAP transporter large permease subunit [Fredinandcohnia sp. FSL W7-1320]|uniref:TRAP transporter large permease subunit n=1 Tax=Fredinandcohnia sp. FSL W7-1320 TaxID=2954540 RepID=UPI0030FDB867